MLRKVAIIALISLIFAAGAAGFNAKSEAKFTPLKNNTFEKVFSIPKFSSSELCTVRHDLGAYWLIQHWVTGMELYKSYQNPSLSCTGPYPFEVQEIYMILYFDMLCTLNVSVDIEAADLSNANCPVPGTLLAISAEYTYIIPGSGLYLIAVPLDSGYSVNGPYFAGFYISNYLDSTIGASIVTDSVVAKCTGYNIWDTTIGFIDLCDNNYFDFPGRMLLYSGGSPGGGGGGTQPEPSITLLKPGAGEAVSGGATLWGSEKSGSDIIEYVRFDRRLGGSWMEIGRDQSGARALRNGVDPSGTGEGYIYNWSYSALTEGMYWVKATVYDTLGRIDVDSHQVSIDPTPPDLSMTNPLCMDSICLPVELAVTSQDENISEVIFESKAASMNYVAPVVTLAQSKFGNYYCGPVAGAIAVKYWFDKGFIYGMREGSSYLSIDTVTERLAANMLTGDNNGTYDDLFYGGFAQYTLTHGNELQLNTYRKPDYWQFRTLFQERELCCIMALSGSPGVYLVAAGVSGLADTQGRYAISVSDPISGTLVNCYMKNVTGGSQVYFQNSWHDLDMIITVRGYSHTVARDLIGMDDDPSNGLSFNWSSGTMNSDSLYYITATTTDATGRIGMTSNLVRYYCKGYVKGDYNDDGTLNIGDVLLLINYIYRQGAAPAGGTYRADANCNGTIDMSDVIIVIRYLYLHGTEPCY
jgi:hypothetical protein